jgi:CubicO group peptidase (beta-lactamase class C family)
MRDTATDRAAMWPATRRGQSEHRQPTGRFKETDMRTQMYRTAVRMLPALVAAAVAVPVAALSQPAWAAPAPSGCETVTPANLATFFDGEIPRLLQEGRIPGAVVSVVSGGTTAFTGGYGTADVEHGVPFSASRSLVRVASISKLFTWTAVMQQVEAGRLDLNTDVNRYLKDFNIPNTFSRPVTLQNLMDHTAGFEDYIIGTAAHSADDVPPLGDYLAHHMPARITPPGEVSAYSNYGAALAGYIVAQVSGEPYDAYVQHHILDPLAMTHSTAAQPLPAALAGDLARSYDSDVNPPRRIPFMFDPLAPDGSMDTTATDIANFMNAQLHGGRFGTNEILSPTTTAQMQQRSFAADPRLDGYAHGFMDHTINGHRILMHDGGWEGFRSVLMLVPGCDLGLFLSMNGTSAEKVAGEFTDAFFNRFTPAPAQPDAAAASVPAGRTTVTTPRAGFYEPTRHNESTVEKVSNLLSQFRLTIDTDGTVHFGGKNWKPQGAGLYRAGATDRMVFLAGTGGRRYVAVNGTTYELMSRTETLPFNLIVLLVVGLAAISTLALPVVWLLRRLLHRTRTSTGTWRAARIFAAGTLALGVVFLAALTATLIGNTDEFQYHVPLSFQLLLAVPVIALGAGLAAVALTVRGWRNSAAGIVARIHQVAMLGGIVVLAWILWQWNLIGWQYA